MVQNSQGQQLDQAAQLTQGVTFLLDHQTGTLVLVLVLMIYGKE